MPKPSTIFCNVLWLLSTLPGWLCFRVALIFPKQTQRGNLHRILRKNKNTELLKNKDFNDLPLSGYEDILPSIESIMAGKKEILTSEQPSLLEPTGGSTSGTKFIPYTPSLKKEFQRATDPWIAELFIKHPRLLLGRHYWCITPSTLIQQESVIPIGFDTDAAYLGRVQQIIASHTLAIPPGIAKDTTNHEFDTLLHLINTPDLRLISVWHPSLLTLMLQTLETRFDDLLYTLEAKAPHRAHELREIGCTPSAIWKKLKIISCWAGDTCRPWIEQLQTSFPNITIQPKGLVATEGITSIPLGNTTNVAAVRSHYFEFECPDTQNLLPLWKVEQGKTYHLILTTGGGLYRYKTNDLIKVDGFLLRTPRIRFLTRNNMTSDLVGEKLTLAHAEQICRHLPCKHRFAMIAPEKSGNQFRYALYIETNETEELETYLETQLSKNYHYRHARNLHQLSSPAVHIVQDAHRKTINYLSKKGRRAGNIKLFALRKETHWGSVLQGGTA